MLNDSHEQGNLALALNGTKFSNHNLTDLIINMLSLCTAIVAAKTPSPH